ncbi:hypothetical protein [Marinovum sp.]|uniref:hypothetical protein n=1 Tax=Marinovum sp. TaxID=2024839 RepID=UPI002B27452F|nr:hypothetical protein [Marinovum sp.]
MTRLATLIATGLLAGLSAAPAEAFGAGSLPLLTFPAEAETPIETPTRGPCLLCPAEAG